MKSFTQELGSLLKLSRVDLIEKDFILHNILLSLSQDEFFYNNFLFKGGTCLIKSYLGYYRFSEDIDFTWREQSVFENMSQKRIRRYLSNVIDKTGKIFMNIANTQGLDFSSDKSDKKYVELGGGDKTATFKLWFKSEIMDQTMFVKVQINFVEKLNWPPIQKELKSLLSDHHYDQLEKLFPKEYERYSKSVDFPVYDQREILCEKVRSILTRRGIKARDFVDVFLITSRYDLNISEFKPQINEKTAFTLSLYEKYRTNLERKSDLIDSGDIFDWGAEKELLLKEMDETDFNRFVEDFIDFLKEIVEEIGGA